MLGGESGFSRLSARKYFFLVVLAAGPSANLKGLHMQNAVNSSDAIADNFKQAVNSETNEMEVLGHLIAEILHSGMPVTNKAIIAALIGRLEQEADVVQLDVYRHLLELVVHQTPDDLSL